MYTFRLLESVVRHKWVWHPLFILFSLKMIETSLFERIRSIASEVISARSFEFVHFESAGTKRNPVFRIYVDKEGGITIDDCSEVSRAVEDLLDADDFIPTAYVLEVSSPGIERGLYSIADFIRFSGHEVRLKTVESVSEKSNFVGILTEVVGEDVFIEDRNVGSVRIAHANVKKANLKWTLIRNCETGSGRNLMDSVR